MEFIYWLHFVQCYCYNGNQVQRTLNTTPVLTNALTENTHAETNECNKFIA